MDDDVMVVLHLKPTIAFIFPGSSSWWEGSATCQ